MGSGGSGGGGAGNNVGGVPGSTNLGGGAGGGPNSAGGSGLVIIAYPGPQRGTGGTYSSTGGNSIHTYTASGTFTA